MRRDLFTEDHEAFRELARDFVEKEVVPHYPEWEKGGRMPRDVFKQMGALGMLGMAIPEEYGGGGVPDYRYNVVLQEEAARALVTLSTVRTQLEVILPYFLHYANDEQRKRWLPDVLSGARIGGMGMTEPSGGTDVLGMGTVARRDGDDYILDGRKTFITNGPGAGVFLVYAKLADRITTFVIERGFAGFSTGAKIPKMGMRASTMSELIFEDCHVPVDNLLGSEGGGITNMMRNLEIERIGLAAMSLGMARRCLDAMVNYSTERRSFGRPLAEHGQVQRYIGESYAKVEAMRALIYNVAATVGPNARITVIVASGAVIQTFRSPRSRHNRPCVSRWC